MAIANGTDVTADADLTSDLGDADGGYVSNNGAPNAPAGTRVHSADGATSQNAQQQRPPVETPPAEKPMSLRERLSSAFKGSEGQPQGQEGAQTAQQAPQDPSRARDPQTGQFLPQQPQEGAQQPAQPQQGQQPPAAPMGLPPAVAQQFATLPAEVQQYVASTMERETKNAQRYRGYDALEQVLAPRREGWAMNGLQPEMAVNQVLALSDFAGRDPEQFISWFAGQHGIDLGVLAEGTPPLDPQYTALQNEIAGLKGQLSQFTQGQQQQQHNGFVQEVENFAAETGQDGQPMRPHFAQVSQDLMALIPAIRQQNPHLQPRDVLAAAYERAVWANPQTRAQVQAAADAQRLADQRRNAGRAQAAGASVAGAPTTGASAPNNAGNGSVRDILRSQFAAS